MPNISPNQMLVTCINSPKDSENIYRSVNEQASQLAARLLKPLSPGYFLWRHLAENKDNFVEALSPTFLEQAYGLSYTSYRRGKSALIDLTYLVQAEDGQWFFYDIPYALREHMLSKDICSQRTYALREQVHMLLENTSYALREQVNLFLENRQIVNTLNNSYPIVNIQNKEVNEEENPSALREHMGKTHKPDEEKDILEEKTENVKSTTPWDHGLTHPEEKFAIYNTHDEIEYGTLKELGEVVYLLDHNEKNKPLAKFLLENGFIAERFVERIREHVEEDEEDEDWDF